MHWYCLFIEGRPAADWRRHRRAALRDALDAGAASPSPGRGKPLLWRNEARIEVCDNARDRDRWIEAMNAPRTSN